MRTVKWNAFLSCLCGFAVVVGVLAASSARADVVTEKSASILIFPAVAGNGDITRLSPALQDLLLTADPAPNPIIVDTVIQITNTSNSMVHARCFYTDAQLPPGCEREAPEIGCVPICQTVDFNIWLTKQQPTHWLVSSGRPQDPTDDFEINVDGAGLDPGPVPPVNPGFLGELKCVEVSADGFPIGGNHLKGEATLKVVDADVAFNAVGDVAKYNAIGIQGTENVGATGNVLQLNNPRGTTDGQYNACPQTLILNHLADVAPAPVVPAPSAVVTLLTLATCSENFEDNIPGEVTIQFEVFNEFEERFSASTTVACVDTFLLSDIASVFTFDALGTVGAQTRMTPADAEDGGVVGVANVLRLWQGTNLGTGTALNIHTEGDRFFGTDGGAFDEIILSDEF